jgi:hypothetical protein
MCSNILSEDGCAWSQVQQASNRIEAMNASIRKIAHILCAPLMLLLLAVNAFTQTTVGTLRGRVRDELGGLIVNATVIAVDRTGIEKRTVTDARGEYQISGLITGDVIVRASARGFDTYETSEVEIVAGRNLMVDIALSVRLENQDVTVGSGESLSAETENNASATVLRGSDLDALPDDADDLAAALQALAGPVAGPQGGQILIDGFLNTGQPLPPRASIREVRISQNPFSAENDRLGFGQIQILTRPGSDRWRGEALFGLSDESFNSRNPFAPVSVPYQLRQYGINLGGPLLNERASLFVNADLRATDDNAVISATVLDAELNITPFNLALLIPQRRMSFSPRFDYQLNPNHTLVTRYSFFRFSNERGGIGTFTLPESAYRLTNTIHTFQLTETVILNPNLLNEFRLQNIYENQVEYGDSSRLTINVLGAFVGGGTQIGLESNPENRLWLQDNLTWTRGNHILRAGARLRHTTITDISTFNFGGSYIFAGGLAPQLDEQNHPVRDAFGQIVFAPISSIERYRRTRLFLREGMTPTEVRALGGGATQFSIGGGNPQSNTTQLDFGAFLQDDWRLTPSLSISLGLRVETQSNIKRRLNLAPRISFAWAPAAKNNSQPKWVVRGGFGLFYDRFNENFVNTASRYNGITQQQFLISDASLLDLFPAVPALQQLAAIPNLPQSIRRIAEDLRAPFMMQSALSLERQLPYKTTLTLTFVSARTLHALRSRNVNAPLPGTFIEGQPASGVRPDGSSNNILLFESSGRANQNQLIVNVNNRFSRKVTFFANYTWGKINSDTEGLQTFPANSYDLRGEMGRAALDVRHFFSLGGTFDVPLGLRLNPLVIASSGRPFNITTGIDANGDTLFTDRPALEQDLNEPGILITRFGVFDPTPEPGQLSIPRNFAEGPSFFVINLNVSRIFSFGEAARGAEQQQVRGTGAQASGPPAEKRYNLTFSLRVQNIFNRTNATPPIGNLASPFFGQSVSSAGSFSFGGVNPAAGNRRVEAQVRFTF